MYYLLQNKLIVVQEESLDGVHVVASTFENSKVVETHISFSYEEWLKFLREHPTARISEKDALSVVADWELEAQTKKQAKPTILRILESGELALEFSHSYSAAWVYNQTTNTLSIRNLTESSIVVETLSSARALTVCNTWAYNHIKTLFNATGSTFLLATSGTGLAKIVGIEDEHELVVLATPTETKTIPAFQVFFSYTITPPKLNTFKDFPDAKFWETDYTVLLLEFKKLPILASFLVPDSTSIYFKTSNRNYLEVKQNEESELCRVTPNLLVLPQHQSFGLDVWGTYA